MKKGKILVLGILGMLLLILVGCTDSIVQNGNNTSQDNLTYYTNPGVSTSVVKKATGEVISSQNAPSDGKITISVPKDCETIIIITNGDGSIYREYVGAGQTYAESPSLKTTKEVEIKEALELKGDDTSCSEIERWVSMLGLFASNVDWDAVKDFIVEYLSKPETAEIKETVETVMTKNNKDYSEYKAKSEENYYKEKSEIIRKKIEQKPVAETSVTLSDSEKTVASVKARVMTIDDVVVKTGTVSIDPNKFAKVAEVVYTERLADSAIANDIYKESIEAGLAQTATEEVKTEARVAGTQDFAMIDTSLSVTKALASESFDSSNLSVQLLDTALDVVQTSVREETAEGIASVESVAALDSYINPVQETIVESMGPMLTIADVSNSDVVSRETEITEIIKPDPVDPIDTSLEIQTKANELSTVLIDVTAYTNVENLVQRDALNSYAIASLDLTKTRTLYSF